MSEFPLQIFADKVGSFKTIPARQGNRIVARRKGGEMKEKELIELCAQGFPPCAKKEILEKVLEEGDILAANDGCAYVVDNKGWLYTILSTLKDEVPQKVYCGTKKGIKELFRAMSFSKPLGFEYNAPLTFWGHPERYILCWQDDLSPVRGIYQMQEFLISSPVPIAYPLNYSDEVVPFLGFLACWKKEAEMIVCGPSYYYVKMHGADSWKLQDALDLLVREALEHRNKKN